MREAESDNRADERATAAAASHAKRASAYLHQPAGLLGRGRVERDNNVGHLRLVLPHRGGPLRHRGKLPLTVPLVIPPRFLVVARLAQTLVAAGLRSIPGELLNRMLRPAFPARFQHRFTLVRSPIGPACRRSANRSAFSANSAVRSASAALRAVNTSKTSTSRLAIGGAADKPRAVQCSQATSNWQARARATAASTLSPPSSSRASKKPSTSSATLT
jgi:hypothetical protein